jgi:hypothetical protein
MAVAWRASRIRKKRRMGALDAPDYRGAGAPGTLAEQDWNVFQFWHTAGTIEGRRTTETNPEIRFSTPASTPRQRA